MTIEPVYFDTVEQPEWDGWIRKIESSSYLNAWFWINYVSGLSGVLENRSFVMLSDGLPVCVCSLALSSMVAGEHELSFGGAPCSVVAMRSLTPSKRRKISDLAYKLIFDYARQRQAQRMLLLRHPLTLQRSEVGVPSAEYDFEPLRYNLLCDVVNTVVLDLAPSQEELEKNVSKFHLRHIHRSAQKGVHVKVIGNSNIDRDGASALCEEYHAVHMAAAGRDTRPQATWDAMAEAVRMGSAAMFIAYLDNAPLSYLFCGEFGKMAFGWSQANVEGAPKNIPARHLLEWTAAMHYKQCGFSFYELGERHFGAQLFASPTEKELNIGLFKERYGGILTHKIQWHGYFGQDQLRKALEQGLAGYLNASSSPGQHAETTEG